MHRKLWFTKELFQIPSIVIVFLSIVVLVIYLIKPDTTYASIIFNVSFFLITLVTFSYFLRKKKMSWREFGFGDISYKWMFLSLCLMLFVVIVGGFLAQVLSHFLRETSDVSINNSFFKEVHSGTIWLDLLNLKVGMAIAVPFAEELLLRGLLFRFLRQSRGFIVSAIISSLVFALLHFDIPSLPFTFLLGMTNSFVLERTKSMFYPFIIHMGVNSLAMNFVLFSIAN